jgi:polyisoprenoid-binding protein YceI
MSTKNILIAGLTLLIGGAIAGLALFNLAFTNNTAPSGPITAIPLVISTAAPDVQANQSQATAASAATSATELTSEATALPTSTAQGSSSVVFQIVPDQSQVSFSIYEELGGQPKTVVGTTSEVAGQLAVDVQDLSKTQVGVIQVNARTLITDNDRRNGAIRNFILNTDQYEFITFTPTSITGLSGAAQPGQSFTFQMSGDLTIRNVTRSVTFTVTAQGVSAAQITGTATATVNRGDFNLTIPSVRNVANVGEEVTLQIDFVANAQG